jgi:hypothetical protein
MNRRPDRIHAATIDTTGQSASQARVNQRTVDIGPVQVSDITFQTDATIDCDDVGTGYYVNLPVVGRLESRHRGSKIIASRELAVVFQPGGGSFSGQWAAGTRVLCVRLDQSAVDMALARLTGGAPAVKASFELVMNTRHGLGRTWVEQLLVLSRQPEGQHGLLANPLVSRPLAESLVNGFLLAAEHTRSAAVAASAAPVEPTRPATIQKAIELMETDPRAPLNVSELAASCGVSARTAARLPAPCRHVAHVLPAGRPAAPGRRRTARGGPAGRHRGRDSPALGIRPPRPVRGRVRGAIRAAARADAARGPLTRFAAIITSFSGQSSG